MKLLDHQLHTDTMMKLSNNHHDHYNNNKVKVVLASSNNMLVSKETSVATSSCRVYYGTAAGAIPFMWESQPGTPKHTLSETSLPPLTPPPSYSINVTPKHSTMQRSGCRAKALLESIFPRALKYRKAVLNTSPSSSSSLSWSSSSWSTSSKGTQKQLYTVSRVLFGYDDEDEDEGLNRRSDRSPTSTFCFGGIKRRGSDYLRSFNSMRKIKFAFMYFASHEQSHSARRSRTVKN